jgi:hypothetical protein
MNHELMMRQVPKGAFELAIGRFGRAFGKGFGGFVDRLNQDAGFIRSLVEFIKDPNAAFVRMLLQYLDVTITVEEVQRSISMQNSAETDKLFDRAMYWARRAHPRLAEPPSSTRRKFVPYTIWLIQNNRVAGIVATQYLVFELGLRRLICATLNEAGRSFDWTILEDDPDNERKSEILRRFFNETNFYWNLTSQQHLSYMWASKDQFVEAAWAILKYEGHRRKQAQPV